MPTGEIDTDSTAHFSSRDEIKKRRELEEARKSGLIPAEKDEQGNDINPHIPQYIAKAPWYISKDVSKPSLKHQRVVSLGETPAADRRLNQWYERGVLSKRTGDKFRPGACQNCGAATHTSKGCTERPRKKGAKWSGTNIQPDEIIGEDLDLDFDGKRDRYGGYDPASFEQVIREHALTDEARRKQKALALQDSLKSVIKKSAEKTAEDKSLSDASSDDEEDDVRVRDFDQGNVPIGMKDDRTRTTTMNLRIREDTAKYLYNLDVQSAFYDPKTRSMRDNPMIGNSLKAESVLYRGDNEIRNSGDASVVREMEVFSWEAYKRTGNVHPQAQPTQLALVHLVHEKTKQELGQLKREHLLERYGVSESMLHPSRTENQSDETFVEYDPVDGSVVSTEPKLFLKSRFEEDVLWGAHTQVWGSWYDGTEGLWGYRCCKSTSRAGTKCSS